MSFNDSLTPIRQVSLSMANSDLLPTVVQFFITPQGNPFLMADILYLVRVVKEWMLLIPLPMLKQQKETDLGRDVVMNTVQIIEMVKEARNLTPVEVNEQLLCEAERKSQGKWRK